MLTSFCSYAIRWITICFDEQKKGEQFKRDSAVFVEYALACGAHNNQDAKVTMQGCVPSLVKSWRHSSCMDGLDWSSLRCVYLTPLGIPSSFSRNSWILYGLLYGCLFQNTLCERNVVW